MVLDWVKWVQTGQPKNSIWNDWDIAEMPQLATRDITCSNILWVVQIYQSSGSTFLYVLQGVWEDIFDSWMESSWQWTLWIKNDLYKYWGSSVKNVKLLGELEEGNLLWVSQAVTIPVNVATLLTGNWHGVTGNFGWYPHICYCCELIVWN